MTRTDLLRSYAVTARADMLRSGYARDVAAEPHGASASIALLVFLVCFGLAVGLGSLFLR